MNKDKLQKYIRTIGEYFVNYDIIQQTDQQYRTRILASSLIVFVVYSTIVALILLIQYFQGLVEPIGFFISIIISFFYLFCLISLKKTGKNLLIAHALAIPLYTGLLASSFITGGSNASSNQIYLLIPLILFFTAGARSGFFWTGIVLLTQLTIFIMDLNGFEFKQNMSPQTQIEQGFLHWTLTLSGIIGIAMVYEKAHQHLVAQRNMRETDIRHLNTHDILTNVNNRQSLEKSLQQHLRSSHKHKLTLTLFIIDIRKFHQINKRYGYTVGDNILLTLADRLKKIPEIKIIGRTNGNQFTLITHGHNKDFNLDQLLTHALQLASMPFNIGHQIVSLNINIGYSMFSNGMMTSEELMLQAEESLENAKGRNLAFVESTHQ